MSQTPATNKQIPDNAILDHFNKQVYLGNKYNYVYAVTTSGTSEVPAILLTNPANTKAFPAAPSLFVDLRMLSGLTAASTNVLRTYLTPTITGVGTVATPVNLRSGSSFLSVASLSYAPTASANGTLIEAIACGAFANSSASGLIIVDPGFSLLITLQSINSAAITAQLGWYEL